MEFKVFCYFEWKIRNQWAISEIYEMNKNEFNIHCDNFRKAWLPVRCNCATSTKNIRKLYEDDCLTDKAITGKIYFATKADNYKVFMNDGINEPQEVYSTDKYLDAVSWVKDKIQNYITINEFNHCEGNPQYANNIANFSIFSNFSKFSNDKPIEYINGVPILREPLYISRYFYI